MDRHLASKGLTRRDNLRLILTTGIAPALLKASQRKPGDKPNLLFIWTDQQRADTLAAYGNHRYRVPALNRLASESIVFENAYVAQPVCTPSRSCVMTGLWPHTNGCVRNNIPLSPEAKTVPELLEDSSYRTGYFGKWHLGDEVFAQRGFQDWQAIEDGYSRHYSPARDRNVRSGYHHFLVQQGYEPGKQGTFSRGFAASRPAKHSKPAFLATESASFIMEHRDQPWMLYVNFLEPHTPFSSAYNDLHSKEEARIPKNWPGIPESDEPEWYIKRRETQPFGSEFGRFNAKDRDKVQRANRNYAGLCSLVDQAVGRILWALEASGQADNTIVVFTSDHGEMLGSHSLYAKSVMYEESVKVPLLLKIPFRHRGGMRWSQPVSHVDLAPTVLHLLGNRKWGDLQGFSHLARLEGKTSGDDHVYVEWTADNENSRDARTVISPDGWKYVVHHNDRPMLHNRMEDPLEMHNRAGQAGVRSIESAMRSKLDAWRKRTKDTSNF